MQRPVLTAVLIALLITPLIAVHALAKSHHPERTEDRSTWERLLAIKPVSAEEMFIPTPPLPPPPPPPPPAYAVAEGDTLISIAVGHGIGYCELANANGISSELIEIGRPLLLPAPGTVPADCTLERVYVPFIAVSSVRGGVPPTPPIGTTGLYQLAYNITAANFGAGEWPAMEALIDREGGWNLYAYNSSSGACGIPQALPCGKMGCDLSDAGCQLNWMADYIANRYGTPSTALWHNRAYSFY